MRLRERFSVRGSFVWRVRSSLAMGLVTSFGLAATIAASDAQDSAKSLTPDSIKAAISAVDSAYIKANAATSNNWPTIGLDYAETRF